MSSEKDAVEKVARDALKSMKNAGFEISDRFEIVVDSKLPFMGYSTKRDGRDLIVISGQALKSGMIEELLIHEMSHIYRINTNHPSHNHELLNRVEQSIIPRSHLTEDYQITIIQQAINHIQDLYADDVAFKVFSQSMRFSLDQLFNFFLSWINDRLMDSGSPKTTWLNIGIMLNSCFALSNIARHNVPDINNQAGNRVQKLLSQTNKRMREVFGYLRSFVTNLKENITEKKFEEGLTKYLIRIIELVN